MREPPIYDSMGQTHLTTAVAHTHTRMYIYIIFKDDLLRTRIEMHFQVYI